MELAEKPWERLVWGVITLEALYPERKESTTEHTFVVNGKMNSFYFCPLTSKYLHKSVIA